MTVSTPEEQTVKRWNTYRYQESRRRRKQRSLTPEAWRRLQGCWVDIFHPNSFLTTSCCLDLVLCSEVQLHPSRKTKTPQDSALLLPWNTESPSHEHTHTHTHTCYIQIHTVSFKINLIHLKQQSSMNAFESLASGKRLLLTPLILQFERTKTVLEIRIAGDFITNKRNLNITIQILSSNLQKQQKWITIFHFLSSQVLFPILLTWDKMKPSLLYYCFIKPQLTSYREILKYSDRLVLYHNVYATNSVKFLSNLDLI